GCLMQITAGSLLGAFGPGVQRFSQWMLEQGLVHFVSTDAHGTKSRRPLLRDAMRRVAELVDEETAGDLCSHYPALVAQGQAVPAGRRPRRRRSWRRFLPWSNVA